VRNADDHRRDRIAAIAIALLVCTLFVLRALAEGHFYLSSTIFVVLIGSALLVVIAIDAVRRRNPARPVPPAPPALDYDQAIPLDAENLAEGGIAEAYEEVRAAFAERGIRLGDISQDFGEDAYTVTQGGRQWVAWTRDMPTDHGEHWLMATVALFQAVNTQLAGSGKTFYALNGGNDLFGILLSEDEMLAARGKLPRRSDWPWLPNDAAPDFGELR
jgi:hypothetical protein